MSEQQDERKPDEQEPQGDPDPREGYDPADKFNAPKGSVVWDEKPEGLG
jgi:hypothetical protein